MLGSILSLPFQTCGVHRSMLQATLQSVDNFYSKFPLQLGYMHGESRVHTYSAQPGK